jgi:uncharacterized membrane protein YccC
MNRSLLFHDPGLQRTLLASRVTLSLILGTVAGWLTGRATGQPGTLMMLAAVTAMQTAMVVFGPAEKPRLSAVFYAFVTAAAATALAIAVTPSPVARYVTFVIVMAAAVWMRRFAVHGFGLGMMAFNAFFFPLFMRARPSQLGWLLLYVALGVAAATFVRVLLLPHRPRATLRRLLAGLRARCASLAGAAAETDARLNDDMLAIDEIVLQMHELIDAEPGLVEDEHQFSTDLFAVVSLSQLLAMEKSKSLLDVRTRLAPAGVDPVQRLFAHLEELDQAFAQGPRIDQTADAGIDAVNANTKSDAKTESDANTESDAHTESDADLHRAENSRGLRDMDRAAIQVAIAAVLSIAVGSMLSEQRWYWAAMTAFYMFINAAHRGVGLRRAVDRTIGTVGGIAGGLLLSYLLAEKPMLELVLLFPVIFVGFWMLKSSYAVMTVMITIMLALMYEMMGMLTFGLLLLRLGETFIGAGIGVAVMYFVLPSRTSDAVARVYEEYFDAVDEMLGALCGAATEEAGAAGDSMDVVRRMGRAMGVLETTLRPLISSVPGRRARQLRQELVLALTIRYALHRLMARIVFHSSPLDVSGLRDRARAVRSTLAQMRADRASSNAVPASATPGVPPATPEAAVLARVEVLLGLLMQSRLRHYSLQEL